MRNRPRNSQNEKIAVETRNQDAICLSTVSSRIDRNSQVG